jgi:hypothetical protein
MSVGPAIVIAGEVGKVLLGLYFEYMKQQGLSNDEIERLYLETKLAFLSKDTSTIPDPK